MGRGKEEGVKEAGSAGWKAGGEVVAVEREQSSFSGLLFAISDLFHSYTGTQRSVPVTLSSSNGAWKSEKRPRLFLVSGCFLDKTLLKGIKYRFSAHLDIDRIY